jgi:outer membrane protein OmpA-like peptidoglycan-associated protein
VTAGDVEIDADGVEASTPVWAVFGDLMAGLLGAFVLILLFALASQLELVTRLHEEIRQHQLEEQRRAELERALAVPLAAGRVTIDHGRIDINGSVLFAFNSAELQPDGRALLKTLAAPIGTYLKARDEILMVAASPTTARCVAATTSSPTTGSCRPSAR